MYEVQMHTGKAIEIDADRFKIDDPHESNLVGNQFLRFYKDTEEIACYVIAAVAGWRKK